MAQRTALQLVTRLRRLEMALLDDAAPDESESTARLREFVANVLATEEGITDEIAVERVTQSRPRFFP